MENEKIKPIPTTLKSPHELAAQIVSISTSLKSTMHPNGKHLDETYETKRRFVVELLESGVSKDQLEKELERLLEQCKKLGIYSPLESDQKDEFISYEKEYYISLGCPEDEAEAEARNKLLRQGYLAELRRWRHDYENEIKKHFQDSIARHPIEKSEEDERIKRLREQVIFLSNPEQSRELASQFPGGNFLYHSTGVEQAIAILESGYLLN